MGIEIERKFLVAGAGWREGARREEIRQGYLAYGDRCVVRVRTKGEHAFLTVKASNRGVARAEFEYEVPVADALALLALAQKPPIEKTRHVVTVHGKVWEVDEFHGANAGLVVAEIELTRADEAFVKPAWAGAEVTDDARYANANLAEHPYGSWTK